MKLINAGNVIDNNTHKGETCL